MNRLFNRLRAAAYWAEDQFDWLFRNPVFPAQILLLLLASWGVLGADLGIERLFWSESPAVQLSSGLAVGMLFGVILFVWYLLDRPNRAVALAAFTVRCSLFPSKANVRVFYLGAYLLWAMPLLLTVMIVGKALIIARAAGKTDPPFHTAEYLAGRHYFLYGILGYLLSIVLAHLLYQLDERLGLRNRIARWPIFHNQPGFRNGRVRPGEITLHAVSTFVVCVGLIFLAAAMAVLTSLNQSEPGRVAMSPVVLVCLVFILITQIYGYWSFHIRLATLTLVLVLLGLAAWNSPILFPEEDYKLRFPGLETYYQPQRRVKLGDLNDRGFVGEGDAPLPRPGGKPQLSDAEILAEIKKRWQQKPGQEQNLPKLIVVAVSGGGIRSALWTGIVLEGLEKEMPGADGRGAFRDHIRLFTGASGGMVGATMYVADFDHDWPDRGKPTATPQDVAFGLGPVAGTLAEQSLLPTLQTAVMRDFSRNLFVPPWKSVDYDRGRSLEDKWMLNARARGYGSAGTTQQELDALRKNHRLSPFNRTFAGLYETESKGLRPSLIYSPMLVEDSRRLLVSNLDLGKLAVAVGPVARKPEESLHRHDGQYSRSGLEFFKLFPDAHATFEVGTAARMSATFPVVTPAVGLPTEPVRRVVDAGYFDNYGVDLAVMWLIQNRPELLKYCSGVALVEIRAFPLQQRGLVFNPNGDPENAGAAGLLGDMVAAVSMPLRAVLRARGNASYHRNNELLAALDHAFNTNVDINDPYFRRFVFELDTDASLNWYLSSEEIKRIVGRFRDDEGVKNQTKALAEWLSTGGAPAR